MGDSAGGGFSLALVQEILKTDSLDLPRRLILISPWVDVTGGDDALQKYDTFLSNEVLRHVGADWAGELDPRDPIVSPLYGDMRGLPATDLFTGTWEVFYSDIIMKSPLQLPRRGRVASEGGWKVKRVAPKPLRGRVS